VKIGNGEAFEQVNAFGHLAPLRYTEIVQIHSSTIVPLEMTGERLVFVDEKETQPVYIQSKFGIFARPKTRTLLLEKSNQSPGMASTIF